MSGVLLPPPLAADAHKGDAGRVLCIAGSAAYPGAAQLCAGAAVRGGAGLVTVAVLESLVVPVVAAQVPEAVYLDLTTCLELLVGRLPEELSGHRHDVRVAGPGLGQGAPVRALVEGLVRAPFEGPLILDADALNVLAGELGSMAAHRGPVLLTPHPGEAARLLGRVVPADPYGRKEAASELAERAGAICILKGRGTVVSDGARTWTCDGGNPGMATAGSGDVLTGLLGALCCAVKDDYMPFEAARAAVEVHALAGDLAAAELGQRGLAARDLVRHLPGALREVEGS